MMTKVLTAALFGLKGSVVKVEVDLARGFPGYNLVGLAGRTIRESGYRIRSAMVNGGYTYPAGRITVNLSPAQLRKEGSHFDLPIAVGLLASMGEIPLRILDGVAFLGELSLDGKLVPVKGALPLTSTVAKAGIKKVILPKKNQEEASLERRVQTYGATTLGEVIRFLKGERDILCRKTEANGGGDAENSSVDFSDIYGQESVKRAMIISAAGGHGLWMRGSPGVGKTMMARRLPSILPPMSFEEMVEVTNIYSVAGLLSEELPLIEKRPFRYPHHTVTVAGLLGGGSYPQPGEFSLAHRGVLFLDELAQFESRVLDALRQPLEEERVVVARQGGAAIFPGKVIFVAASNPCKCGYLEEAPNRCTCSALELAKYEKKLALPFLDRIDLHIRVGRGPVEVKEGQTSMSSKKMRKIVIKARERQRLRYGEKSLSQILLNGQLGPKELQMYCKLGRKEEKLLAEAYRGLGLSMRTCHKTVKIARTIADIEGKKEILWEHIAEALQYRGIKKEAGG